MRDNTTITSSSISLSSSLFSARNQKVPENQNMNNHQHYFDVNGDVLPTPRGT